MTAPPPRLALEQLPAGMRAFLVFRALCGAEACGAMVKADDRPRS